ncbi:MAG TPA: hypothetical protein VN493_04635 [Thermoanaerobaculia bacterium]|nr:hypothetical protein [Thermoanaerobaculia bacterium]
MMKVLLNRMWVLYSEIVHQALFLDIISHALPVSVVLILAAAAEFAEKHGTFLMLAGAVAVSVTKNFRASKRKKPAEKRKASRSRQAQARDKNGRFVRRSEKRSR